MDADPAREAAILARCEVATKGPWGQSRPDMDSFTENQDYPFDWKWSMEMSGEVGLDNVDMATMHGLVGSGAGRVKEFPKTGRVEYARFLPNRERAEFLLNEPKPSHVDATQLNWIPEDHPALAKVAKKESHA